MAKVTLEWQVELRQSGYHLNGRGATPEQAMEDLRTRVQRQIDTASEENARLMTKLSKLGEYQGKLNALDFEDVEAPEIT